MFHLCYNLPRETKWQSTFNKLMVYGAVGMNTYSPHKKCMGHTANIPKNHPNFRLR